MLNACRDYSEERGGAVAARPCDPNDAASRGKRDGEEVGKTRAAITCVKLLSGSRFRRGRRTVITIVRERSHRSRGARPRDSSFSLFLSPSLYRSIFLRRVFSFARALFSLFPSPLPLSVITRFNGSDWIQLRMVFFPFPFFNPLPQV